MRRVLLDGMAIRPGGRGVARMLRHVLPLLAARSGCIEYVIVTNAFGKKELSHLAEVVTAPAMVTSVWEQVGLPACARRMGAAAVYSHSECGPLWGPRLCLHVPEDPEFRWSFTPADTTRERFRRLYQRSTWRVSVLRSEVLVTSSLAVKQQYVQKFGAALSRVSVVPLGVDRSVFYEESSDPSEGYVFHLGGEVRDQSRLVIRAYAEALRMGADLPELVIAGGIRSRSELLSCASHAGVAGRVRIAGRVSDEELRRHYANALFCIQPSLYEGFGLQPLEALSCGAALIILAEPAVVEVVRDAAVVARDASVAALARKIAALATDGAYRAELRRKGPELAKGYSWATTADGLHAVIRGIVEGDV